MTNDKNKCDFLDKEDPTLAEVFAEIYDGKPEKETRKFMKFLDRLMKKLLKREKKIPA